MSKRTIAAALAALWVLATAAAGASAGQEQWLGYRSAGQAFGYVGYSPGQTVAGRPAPPEGVALPKFTGKPLFALWKVDVVKLTGPAARDGGLWMALARSGKSRGAYDTLYLDANGNGSLADERPIPAEHTYVDWKNPDGTVTSTSFGTIRLALPGNDGTIAYHAGFHYQRQGDGPHNITVSASCWYEGVVVIAGRRMMCSLIDCNANWRFGERSTGKDPCDGYVLRPFLTGMGPQELADAAWTPLGQYVRVGGKYYTMDIAPDGATVALSPAAPAMGRIVPGRDVTSLRITGPAGTFDLGATNGRFEAPEGEYRLKDYEVAQHGADGNTWRIRSRGKGKDKPIVVRADAAAALPVGGPFVWRLTASRRPNGRHIVSLTLRDRGGATGTLTCNERRPLMRVRIANSDKTYDRTFSLEYG